MIFDQIIKKEFLKLKDFRYWYFYADPKTFDYFFMISVDDKGYKINSNWLTKEQFKANMDECPCLPYLLPDKDGIFKN